MSFRTHDEGGRDDPSQLNEAQSRLQGSDRFRWARLWLLVAIAVILVGWALHATGAVFVPVVFSVFLALVVAPLDRWVAHRAPVKLKWLGHVAAMTTILLALLLFIGGMWIAAQQVVSRFPARAGQIVSVLPQFGGDASDDAQASNEVQDAARGASLNKEDVGGAGAGAGSAGKFETGGALSQLAEVFSGAGGALGNAVRNWASSLAATIVTAAGTTLAGVVLVFFLTLLMLIEGPRWQEKISVLLNASARQDTFESLGVIAGRLRGYLLARTLLGVITAALYVAWLWIFGVDLLIVWALLAFLLNFIPNLGSLVAGVLPVVYAFVQKDFGSAAMIGAGIFVIEQIMGNFVDPRVQGRQVSLSPLAILVVLLLWGWIWGVAGAILAVPITIAMVIVCAHVAVLRPFALLLSNERDMQGLDRIARRPNA